MTAPPPRAGCISGATGMAGGASDHRGRHPKHEARRSHPGRDLVLPHRAAHHGSPSPVVPL
jgi:hypothetical protein